jgi:hypothetical protein
MSEGPKDLLGEFIGKAFDEAVKAAVSEAFMGRWGHDDGAKIISVVREAAEKMLRTDPEVNARLKKRLIELIERGVTRA